MTEPKYTKRIIIETTSDTIDGLATCALAFGASSLKDLARGAGEATTRLGTAYRWRVENIHGADQDLSAVKDTSHKETT